MATRSRLTCVPTVLLLLLLKYSTQCAQCTVLVYVVRVCTLYSVQVALHWPISTYMMPMGLMNRQALLQAYL